MSAANPAPGLPGDDLIGITISGRYRIISKLGAGGMGTAYRAWDERDGIPVVIKIPKKIFFEDPKFAERFRREIRLLQGLTHPHIVPITDVGEHEGLPFVVMRFLPGGSLSNRRLRDENGKVRPNPPGMLHLWLPAIADALDHVHAQGVVHRDVKPANIFFDAFWGAYLGDFGIAKIVEESDAFDKEQTLTAAHMGIGTQEYMSPEQFTPRAAIDGRADQYALAVTVHEMLAGPRPFTGATSNLIVEVLTHPVPLVTDVVHDLPASVAAAVQRGLAKNPAVRFATCKEFAAEVLRDVPHLDDEVDLARLLCPNPKCASILKLPTSAAGRKGKCPRCQTEMKVADDLGALWLLDEARRQRKAGSLGDKTDESAGVILAEVGALESFKPVSSTTPIEKAARRGGRTFRPSLLWGGLAAGILVAISIWMLVPPPNTSKSQKRAPPTYEERLRLAEAKLAVDPSDRAANERVGRHWCLKVRDWDKGLPHLAKSNAVGLTAVAEKELKARARGQGNAGERLRVAKAWWNIAKSGQLGTDTESIAAIESHASALYLEHVDSITAQADIAFADNWLKADADFRSLVDGKRPLKPALGVPPDAIAWEKNGHSYKYVQERLHWPAAKRRCEEMGGHLVVIDDASEQEMVMKLLRQSGVSLDDSRTTWDGVWIGATDEAQEGQWKWVDGSPVAYANWGPGEPNGSGNCSVLGNHQGGRWDDQPQDTGFNIFGFICEWPTATRSPQAETDSPLDALRVAPESSSKDLDHRSLENSIGMALKLIPSGTFTMGSNDGNPDEKPVHEVRITRPFHLGVTEVTNAQWKAVMGDVPSKWKEEARPVEQVSWEDAVAFCRKLSALPAEKAAGRVYRLPTENEWEYACRAGTTTRFSFGDDERVQGEFSWFQGNADGQTHLVGSRQPNPWGLYDMHGNVWEWCADGYVPYPKQSVGPSGVVVARTSNVRVLRGGSWFDASPVCRSSLRNTNGLASRIGNVGMRVVMIQLSDPQPNPGTLMQFGDWIGKTFTFDVVGAEAAAPVWGSNPYTADSSLAKAAVHAGALRPGEAGVVRVTILPGQSGYSGSMKNGVTTASWGAWSLSYRIEPREAPAPDPVVGRWRWFVNGGEVSGHEFLPNGEIKGRADSSWQLVEPENRLYRFSWGTAFIDTMTLSADGRLLQGKNNEGVAIEGRRVE